MLPESEALSPSAPRKGTASAPISRRKLEHRISALSPRSGALRRASAEGSVSPTTSPGGSPIGRAGYKGLTWRDRLASMAAKIGTDAQARTSALDVVDAFVTPFAK